MKRVYNLFSLFLAAFIAGTFAVASGISMLKPNSLLYGKTETYVGVIFILWGIYNIAGVIIYATNNYKKLKSAEIVEPIKP